MSRFRALSHRKAVNLLKEHGFVFKRQGKGDHQIYQHPDGRTFIVSTGIDRKTPQAIRNFSKQIYRLIHHIPDPRPFNRRRPVS